MHRGLPLTTLHQLLWAYKQLRSQSQFSRPLQISNEIDSIKKTNLSFLKQKYNARIFTDGHLKGKITKKIAAIISPI